MDGETPTIKRRISASNERVNLELEIEELDDQEYDIPPVGTPPTLESILNEPDELSLAEEEIPGQFDLFQDSVETASVSSSDSVNRKTSDRKVNHKNLHGSLLRHVVLRGVSSQVHSAADRVGAGKPTAMAVSEFIAIGTFHGLVLVFDPQQVLKWCLGSKDNGEEYGSVSALAFNGENSRLLCGYARGQLTMWDVTNGKLLRTILDAHPPQMAVLHVKFTDDPALALCSDSGGSVFELNFRRVMGSRTCESRCIFSGSRGEVCTLEPLRMSAHFRERVNQDVCLVALGTVTKVIVVTVRPYLKAWFSHLLKADTDTLPLLCWQFVVIQVTPTSRVIDPVLAFCRQSVIYFYQVTFTTAEKIKFIPLQRMELQHVVQNFMWLNTRTLVTLDTAEHLHVIDVRSDEELELLDLVDVQLVYGTGHFKGLSTGGNVSKAMAVAGERACYYSMASYGSQLLFLGVTSVHVMTLRTWIERIDFLVKQKKFPEALALGLSFYDDNAKGVTGLVGKRPQRQQLIAGKIVELLNDFVDSVMSQLCPERGKIELLILHYRQMVPLVVDYSLSIGKRDFLFGKAYDKLSSDPLAKVVFLESLESYILDDKLPALTPTIAKEFVIHYSDRAKFQLLEACIVRLDVACLDIHQVMTLCQKHGLYDAIIHIYNKGMNEYVVPLEELLILLQEAVNKAKQLTDEQIRLGNKLLVYISCCLAGRGYPLGAIPSDCVNKVKSDVFKCITKLQSNRKEDDCIYSYLKALLRFDTREFLNVLALAFEEEEFSAGSGMSQRQRTVDILLQVMVHSEGFSPTQVGALFTFLARQVARHEDTIAVDRMLFEQVLEYLTNPSDEARVEERQQALMELLQAGGLSHVNEERLLKLVERAKFYRICEHLYEQRRQFDKILSCYLQDPARKPQVFYYARQVLESSQHRQEEKAALQNQLLVSIKELIDIDNKKTSQLLLQYFPLRLTDVVSALQDEPQILYQLLKGLFSIKQTKKSPQNRVPLTADALIQEKYISLMCRFEPQSAFTYICCTEGYRLEETLQICREFNIRDGEAYLLEKAGDIHGAFQIILEDLNSAIEEYLRDPQGLGWSRVQSKLLVAIQVCQRNTGKMDQPEREALWFPLLDSLMGPQQQLRDQLNSDYIDDFRQLTKHLLNGMMGYITLPAILQKIMQDSSYNPGKFGEIRELLLGMLETYNYEKTLLHTTANLLHSDLHHHLNQLCRTANKGVSCHTRACTLCTRPLWPENTGIMIFRCGHKYHVGCLQTTQSHTDGTWHCYKCQSTVRDKHTVVERRIVELNVPPSLDRSKSGSVSGKANLDSHQNHALEQLHRNQNSASRLLVLRELLGESQRSNTRSSSVLSREDLKLRLVPGKIIASLAEF